jgi:hypothetical protein
MAWATEEASFDSWRGKATFLFLKASRRVLEPTNLTIQYVSRAVSPGIKLPENDVDHLQVSSAEIKNGCSYTVTPLCVFMACMGTALPLLRQRVV